MKENLANLLSEAVSSAIADVSYESGCPYFEGVIYFDVCDGWTSVKVELD